MVIPLLYLYNIHRILPKGLLNLTNCFLCKSLMLLAQLDALTLVNAFCHYVQNNKMQQAPVLHYILVTTDALFQVTITKIMHVL